MRVERLTIKSATIALLLIIALLFLLTTLYTSDKFFNSASHSQQQTLSRVLDVAAKGILQETRELGQEVASAIAKNKAIKKSVKNKDQAGLPSLADDFYAQAYVTAGIVDLVKIRFYDKDGNFIGQSNKGNANLGRNLPPNLASTHRQRSGQDRMKVLTSTWTHHGESLLSVLVPTGGLRLAGYVEAVLKPAHNMKAIEQLVKAPIRIISQSGQENFVSENWQTTAAAGHTYTIHYEVLDASGQPGSVLEMLEDNQAFVEASRELKYTSIGITLLISVVMISLTIVILTKYLFTPMANLKAEMLLCASGDLTPKILKEGFLDTQLIGDALNTLIGQFRQQVHQINEMAQLVSTNSDHIAKVASQTQQHSDQQRSEMEQSSSAISQMTSAAAEIANGAQTPKRQRSNPKLSPARVNRWLTVRLKRLTG